VHLLLACYCSPRLATLLTLVIIKVVIKSLGSPKSKYVKTHQLGARYGWQGGIKIPGYLSIKIISRLFWAMKPNGLNVENYLNQELQTM
jgi:hypothetical protein